MQDPPSTWPEVLPFSVLIHDKMSRRVGAIDSILSLFVLLLFFLPKMFDISERPLSVNSKTGSETPSVHPIHASISGVGSLKMIFFSRANNLWWQPHFGNMSKLSVSVALKRTLHQVGDEGWDYHQDDLLLPLKDHLLLPERLTHSLASGLWSRSFRKESKEFVQTIKKPKKDASDGFFLPLLLSAPMTELVKNNSKTRV